MIIASHRGPYRFERGEDGSFTARRGAGGIVTVLGPLLTDYPDAKWVAAAIGDGDRGAVRAGATTGLDVDLHLLDLEPAVHRMHYDVISNGVLWFLHHDMFDRVRRPRFDIHFRDAWDAYAEVNASFGSRVVSSKRPSASVNPPG